MSGVFSSVGGVRPKRTAFNLSHSNLTTMAFGELVPIDAIECVPGDVFTLNANVVARLSNSLKSPILADMDLIVEAFFCPTRLLQGSDANFDVPVGERNFEELLKRGKDGKELDIMTPLFGVPNSNVTFDFDGIGECLGIQPNVAINAVDRPVAYHWRAYRWIWNEYYRFESLQEPIQVCQWIGDGTSSDTTLISNADYDKFLYRGWRRDYFTSALPYQQFGTSPAFQLDGQLPVISTYPEEVSVPLTWQGSTSYYRSGKAKVVSPSSQTNGTFPNVNYPSEISNVNYGNVTAKVNLPSGSSGTKTVSVVYPSASYNTSGSDPDSGSRYLSGSANVVGGSYVELSNAVTFDISDIRTNFQIQKWLERNARAGVRYTEYLQSHFGVSPRDSRLQRPEFIGAFRMPWLISEVVQTSASVDGQTAQGNQAGQGIALGRGKLGKYRCYEFGYIMLIASVVPKPQYQQGLPRQFSRRVALDFYSPEFAHLSEQGVLNKEIFVSGDTQVDNGIFGFQGIWNELRYLPSRVSRHMRSNAPTYSFDYWHMARLFSETPILNKEFLEVGATDESKSELMRVFAVQNEQPFIVNFGLNIKAVRPLPYLAEPGLVDHF